MLLFIIYIVLTLTSAAIGDEESSFEMDISISLNTNVIVHKAHKRQLMCEGNSFDVSIYNLRFINQLLKFSYKIEPNKQVLNESSLTSFDDYLINCLYNVIIDVRLLNNTAFRRKTFEATTARGEESIKGLPLMNVVQLTVGYSQRSPNGAEHFTDHKNATICFLEPSAIRNLRASQLNDSSLLFEWDEPMALNAPFVCYYEIIGTNLNSNDMLVNNIYTEVNVTKYRVSSRYLTVPMIFKITAVNDLECYAKKYTFVKACTFAKLRGPEAIYDFTDVVTVATKLKAAPPPLSSLSSLTITSSSSFTLLFVSLLVLSTYVSY